MSKFKVEVAPQDADGWKKVSEKEFNEAIIGLPHEGYKSRTNLKNRGDSGGRLEIISAHGIDVIRIRTEIKKGYVEINVVGISKVKKQEKDKEIDQC